MRASIVLLCGMKPSLQIIYTKSKIREFTGMGVLFTVMIEIRKYFIPKDILIMKTGNMRRYHLTSFMKLFRIVRKKEKLR